MNGVLSLGPNGWNADNPTVGRRVRLTWADVQPKNKDEFDWTVVDEQLNKAVGSGRKMGLSFRMCGDDAIPHWVFDMGVKTFDINMGSSGRHTIIRPWDVQGPVVTFNREVAKRYNGKVNYLVMSGLGTYSAESIVCNTPDEIGMKEPKAIERWVTCCTAIVDAYAKFSKDSPFIFTAVPPYDTNDAKNSLSDLVNGKCEQYPDRFGVMNCALNAKMTTDYLPADLVYHNSDTNPVGFQMVACVLEEPERTKGTLEECMNTGYELGAHYIEIYPKDADDRNNRDAIVAMNELLASVT